MSDGLLSPIIDSAVAVGLAIGGGVLNLYRRRMDKIEDDQKTDHDDLAKFKLEAAMTYAREESLKRIYDITDEIRNDIKSIIGKI